jgi:chaperonin GroEL (HSP60 family)
LRSLADEERILFIVLILNPSNLRFRKNVTLAMLGRAKKVMIDKENTTIVSGAGKKADIEARVECAVVRICPRLLIPARRDDKDDLGMSLRYEASAEAIVAAQAVGS